MVQLDLSQRPLRALVVDDEPTMRRTYIGMLRAISPMAEVREAGDGSTAIQILKKERDFRPDIALVDLNMEPMSGTQFARMVRFGHEGMDRYLRIVLITSDRSPEAMTAALRSGVDGFLPKPTTPKQVHDRVRQVLSDTTPFVEIRSEEITRQYFGPLWPYVREHLVPGNPHVVHHRPRGQAA